MRVSISIGPFRCELRRLSLSPSSPPPKPTAPPTPKPPLIFVWNPQSTFPRKFYGSEYNEALARNASPLTHVRPDVPVRLRLDPKGGHDVMSEATYRE